ncbi:DUF4142 domain-containing protein [Sandarakinorhabdus sp.]|uniref:DUF4142 domain-containing protein n=1 Tax=Sandarakinorhabdus sp. TaxID=1916663 RepID=UPI003F6ED42F
MIRMFIAVAASSLVLAGCGEKAADTDQNVAMADGTAANPGMTADGQATMNGTDDPMAADSLANAITGANDPQQYINQAASSDQFEIQSSQLALQQSTNAGLREFAQQMIEDHRTFTQKLQIASTGAALQAPRTEMLAAHQAKLTELKNAGANMDALYLEQQREAHAEAIALHQAMTSNNAAPAQLAGFAREVLPRVQEHARMLDQMKTSR